MELSLPKVLLIFYLIIASGYMKDLYGHQFKRLLEENRLAQHLISLIFIMVIINLLGISSMEKMLCYTLLIYTWFILSTKLDVYWNLLLVSGVVIYYFYESYLDNTEKELDDMLFSSQSINNIKQKNDNIRKYSLFALILITMTGLVLYNNKKGIQYGGNYDIIKFLFY
jgi:hypothetical protein